MGEPVAKVKDILRQPLGRRLSNLRRGSGMKLSEVAEICGISEATMSRVETGQTDISAHHLFLLARQFRVDIADFFASDTRPLTTGIRSLTRKGEREAHQLARYVSEVLNSDISNKDMQPVINHVAAKTLDEVDGLSAHPGEEFLYVLGGSILFHSEFYVPLLMQEGDSLYFEGSMHHAYLNAGDRPAKILVVVGPPKEKLKGNLINRALPNITQQQ